MLRSIWNNLKSLVRPDSPAEPIGENRQQARVRCRYPTTAYFGAADQESCQAIVTDIGALGLRIKTPVAPFAVNAAIRLECVDDPVHEVQSITARVVWSRHRKFSGDTISGLVFLDPAQSLPGSWAEHLLTIAGLGLDAQFQRRNSIRSECNLACDLFGPIGERLGDATVINLSVGGALLYLSDPLAQNLSIRLRFGPHAKLPEVELHGHVVDSRPDRLEGGWRASLCFRALTQEQAAILGKYISRLLQESSAL